MLQQKIGPTTASVTTVSNESKLIKDFLRHTGSPNIDQDEIARPTIKQIYTEL